LFWFMITISSNKFGIFFIIWFLIRDEDYIIYYHFSSSFNYLWCNFHVCLYLRKYMWYMLCVKVFAMERRTRLILVMNAMFLPRNPQQPKFQWV
jgi:hypothetical protein